MKSRALQSFELPVLQRIRYQIWHESHYLINAHPLFFINVSAQHVQELIKALNEHLASSRYKVNLDKHLIFFTQDDSDKVFVTENLLLDFFNARYKTFEEKSNFTACSQPQTKMAWPHEVKNLITLVQEKLTPPKDKPSTTRLKNVSPYSTGQTMFESSNSITDLDQQSADRTTCSPKRPRI